MSVEHEQAVNVARPRRSLPPDFIWVSGYTFTCAGTFDYVYGIWWRCRDCGAWKSHVPEAPR